MLLLRRFFLFLFFFLRGRLHRLRLFALGLHRHFRLFFFLLPAFCLRAYLCGSLRLLRCFGGRFLPIGLLLVRKLNKPCSLNTALLVQLLFLLRQLLTKLVLPVLKRLLHLESVRFYTVKHGQQRVSGFPNLGYNRLLLTHYR